MLTPARSFGAFPTRFALERAIDMVAGCIGLEPAEVRRINLIRDLPYVTATGLNYDSGNWIGAETSGVASDVLVPMENQPGYGSATVRIDPRGKVAIFEGVAPQGQSHETTMATSRRA